MNEKALEINNKIVNKKSLPINKKLKKGNIKQNKLSIALRKNLLRRKSTTNSNLINT